MPRVTRAQAEAALGAAVEILEAVASWGCVATRKDQEPKGAPCSALGIRHPTRACQSCGAAWILPALRAYLAQRPDEETVNDEDERETLWRLAGADVDKMIDAIREVCAEAKAKVAEMPKPEEEA